MPIRATRNLPVFFALALLLPAVVFVVIGRTVEIQKEAEREFEKRAIHLTGSAAGGISMSR